MPDGRTANAAVVPYADAGVVDVDANVDALADAPDPLPFVWQPTELPAPFGWFAVLFAAAVGFAVVVVAAAVRRLQLPQRGRAKRAYELSTAVAVDVDAVAVDAVAAAVDAVRAVLMEALLLRLLLLHLLRLLLLL